MNDVASGDAFQSLRQDEAGDPGGVIGLPGIEDGRRRRILVASDEAKSGGVHVPAGQATADAAYR